MARAHNWSRRFEAGLRQFSGNEFSTDRLKAWKSSNCKAKRMNATSKFLFSAEKRYQVALCLLQQAGKACLNNSSTFVTFG